LNKNSPFLIVSGLLFCACYLYWPLVFAAEKMHSGELLSFDSLYEPSGVVHLGQGEFAVVEDEPERPFYRLKLDQNGRLVESGEIRYAGESVRLNDLEGITFDGRYLYAVTSHSLTKKGKEGQGRSELVRFEYKDGQLHDLRCVSDLKPFMLELFAPSFEGLTMQELKANINIEAMVWSPKDNSLYIGFRQPRVNGLSAVMRIDAPGQLFQRQSAVNMSARLFWLDLQNKGIRSMSWGTTLQKILIVAGRKKQESGFDLWQWQATSKTAPDKITSPEKPLPEGTEGLTTYKTEGLSGMLVVIDDGSENNARPAHYQLFPFVLQ